MKEKPMNAKEYARLRLFGESHVFRGEIEAAFKAGVKEGRRRHQSYLSRLIQKGQWEETDLPLPARDTRLPGYHDLLNHLCDELRVCGAVTFAQAVADVKKRLERKGETFPRIDKGFFSE